MEEQLLSFHLALRRTPPSPREGSQRGASGCTGAAVEWVKTLRQGVAIEGETQAKAAWAKWAGSMGGGWVESWREERMGRMTGGAVRAAILMSSPS